MFLFLKDGYHISHLELKIMVPGEFFWVTWLRKQCSSSKDSESYQPHMVGDAFCALGLSVCFGAWSMNGMRQRGISPLLRSIPAVLSRIDQDQSQWSLGPAWAGILLK